MDTERLDAIVDDALADRAPEVGESAVAGAIQAAVLQRGEPTYVRSAGRTRLDRPGSPVDDRTPFDIASLTKPLVVGTLLMRAVGSGRIALDEPVRNVLPDWTSDPAARGVSWARLANHTAGLPDWRPLYRDLPLDPEGDRVSENRRTVAARLRETEFEYAPGERESYSDLGYIVLGWALEALWGRPLESLARSKVFEPVGLERTRFVSARRSDRPLDGAAATERQPDRGLVVGRVHDRNAAALGGVAGHAGCFSTALELARFGDHLLSIDSGAAPDDPLVDRNVLESFWADAARGGRGHHAVGWDTPSGSPSSAGRGLQAGRTVGHLGFTGTSIWLERDRRLAVVLSTNCVHPSRDNDRIEAFRIRFHEAVVES